MLFYILFLIFYILVAWAKPKWALFLICALLPTYQLRFNVFGLPTTFLEAMILILFVVYLLRITNLLQIYKLRQYNNITIKQFINLSRGWFWLILAWLAVGLIAVFVSPDKWGALGFWRAYFLEPILLLTVILSLSTRINADETRMDADNISVNQRNNQRISVLILFGLSISALICSLWAIGQKIFGGGMPSLETWQYPLKLITRPTGPFPQSNFLGLFLGPLIILFLGKFFEAFKNKKLLVIGYWLLVIMAGALAIIFARSEGAIIGILAGLIFWGVVCQKSRRWTILFLAIVILFVSTLSIICVNPRIDLRQSAICESKTSAYILEKITFQDLSLQMRLNIWQGAVDLIRDHPIFGAGLRGYQKLIANYQQPFSLPGIEGVISNELHPYPHNLFLAIWSELGILGLIVFILIIFQFFKLGFQKLFRNFKLEIRNWEQTNTRKILILSLLSSMVVILTHSLVDTPYFKNDLAILFWLIIGLMIVEKEIMGVRPR